MIVNLQKTRMDSHADLVIHARCDDIMRIVTTQLSIDVIYQKLDLPKDDEIIIIKESYRSEPPPVSKFKVKKIKGNFGDSGDTKSPDSIVKVEHKNGIIKKSDGDVKSE